jgi:hypothetical protein
MKQTQPFILPTIFPQVNQISHSTPNMKPTPQPINTLPWISPNFVPQATSPMKQVSTPTPLTSSPLTQSLSNFG